MSVNKSYKTTCSYCGVGCGILVDKDVSGNTSVRGDPDYPVNKGCFVLKE